MRSHRLNTEQYSELQTRPRARLSVDATRRFEVGMGSDFILYRSSSAYSAKVLALQIDHDVLAEARVYLQRKDRTRENRSAREVLVDRRACAAGTR